MAEDSEQPGKANDMKDKFREALERKKKHTQAGQAHEDARSKAKGASGSLSQKRTFRRKTG